MVERNRDKDHGDMTQNHRLYILRTRDWKRRFLSKLSALERTLMTAKRLARRVVDSFHLLVSS